MDLPADLAAREIARASVSAVDAVVRVSVGVGISSVHRIHQSTEWLARERPNQIRRGDRATGQDAVGSPATRCKWTGQKRHDWAVNAGRGKMDMRGDNVVDVGDDQLVLERAAILAQMEDRLALRPCVSRWDLLIA